MKVDEQTASLNEWLKKSTAARGVPAKVQDRPTIAALQVLVSGARRTKRLAVGACREADKPTR